LNESGQINFYICQMEILRIIYKSIGVVFFTLFYFLILLTGSICLSLIGRKTERWRNRILSIWGKTVAYIFSIKINIEGEPPAPPFILVSNHLSYLDIVVYYAIVDATIVSKAEVSRWPVFGFIAKNIGVIFIDREKRMDVKRVNKEIAENVNPRSGVLIFPEGRISPGDKILPFKPSLLEFAVAENIKVYSSTLCYDTLSDDPGLISKLIWYGDEPMLSHFLRFCTLKRSFANVTFSEDGIIHDDRKELAKLLYERVSDNYKPVYLPEYQKKVSSES